VAVSAAANVVGAGRVETAHAPSMGAEGFTYMLVQRPGAIILVGNGDDACLHHLAYNFDDRAIIYGVKYWLSFASQELGRL